MKEERKYDDLYISELADLFKMFADPTRLRIMTALFKHEVNVRTLAQELEMTDSAISHQLRFLKGMNLVRGRREGRQIYYALADDHVKTIIAMGCEHIEED